MIARGAERIHKRLLSLEKTVAGEASSSSNKKMSQRREVSLVKSENQVISQETSRLQKIRLLSVIKCSMHGVKKLSNRKDSRSLLGKINRSKDKTEVLDREIGRRREIQDQGSSKTRIDVNDVSKILFEV